MWSSEKKREMSEIFAKTKATKSAVWEHFRFEQGDDGWPKQEAVATCRLCKKTVSAKGGNTSNLLTHLKKPSPAETRWSTEGYSRYTEQNHWQDEFETAREQLVNMML